MCRTSTTKLDATQRDMESDRESRLAKETEVRQLERDNALLQHKLQESQRKTDIESEKRRKVKINSNMLQNHHTTAKLRFLFLWLFFNY